MHLPNFVSWLLKCLPEISDLLTGPWLVSKTNTLLRILFFVFLQSSYVLIAAHPFLARCPHLTDGQS